jgi:DNA-binding transcriptional LysR family regulator
MTLRLLPPPARDDGDTTTMAPAKDRRTPVVGCVPDLPLQRLQAFLGALYARDPTLLADVVHLHSAEQVRRLRAGDLDVGLVHHADGPGVAAQPLFEGEAVAAFVAVGHRLATAGALTPADVAREPAVLIPHDVDEPLHDRFRDLARSHGFRGIVESPGGDVRDLLMAVADGRGVGLAPASAIETAGAMGDLVTAHALDPPPRMPDTLVAWRDPPPATHALAVARDAARDLASAGGH